ncbi:FkbM family methyltransferase [Amylibacter sp.]|jgi:FkbM family methyltransferase|nr:FkbM family methyltransferase [Amylibacter sp.]
MYQNTLAIYLRNIFRRLGLLRYISYFLPKKSYELEFEQHISDIIIDDDIVWDVGANIGFYTTRFAKLAHKGKVIAFEPSEINYEKLLENTIDVENIDSIKCALGSEVTELFFEQGSDNIGATSKIVNETKNSKIIKSVTGDDLIYSEHFSKPNIIKIDVEGYELEVIIGLSKFLKSGYARAVFIEVHFAYLNEKYGRSGVQRLLEIIKNMNYDIKWIDSSHIQAVRKNVNKN